MISDHKENIIYFKIQKTSFELEIRQVEFIICKTKYLQ